MSRLARRYALSLLLGWIVGTTIAWAAGILPFAEGVAGMYAAAAAAALVLLAADWALRRRERPQTTLACLRCGSVVARSRRRSRALRVDAQMIATLEHHGRHCTGGRP